MKFKACFLLWRVDEALCELSKEIRSLVTDVDTEEEASLYFFVLVCFWQILLTT